MPDSFHAAASASLLLLSIQRVGTCLQVQQSVRAWAEQLKATAAKMGLMLGGTEIPVAEAEVGPSIAFGLPTNSHYHLHANFCRAVKP